MPVKGKKNYYIEWQKYNKVINTKLEFYSSLMKKQQTKASNQMLQVANISQIQTKANIIFFNPKKQLKP